MDIMEKLAFDIAQAVTAKLAQLEVVPKGPPNVAESGAMSEGVGRFVSKSPSALAGKVLGLSGAGAAAGSAAIKPVNSMTNQAGTTSRVEMGNADERAAKSSRNAKTQVPSQKVTPPAPKAPAQQSRRVQNYAD